jgi:hypothetical protein
MSKGNDPANGSTHDVPEPTGPDAATFTQRSPEGPSSPQEIDEPRAQQRFDAPLGPSDPHGAADPNSPEAPI